MLVRVKQAEDDLEKSRDELRALAAELQSVREEERTAIAREIHDELGQTLTSLQLGLAWIAAKWFLHGNGRCRPKSRRCRLWSRASFGRSARSRQRCRPGVLDELGLVKALKSEAREFKRHTGIPCGFRTNVGQRDIRPCRRRRCLSDRPGGAHECGPACKGLAGQRCSREGKKRLGLDGPRQRQGDPRGRRLQSWCAWHRGDARARPCAGRDADASQDHEGRGTTLKARIPLSRVLAGKSIR